MTTAPVIHWFRRDLRLHDNTSLNAARASGQPVLPVFVLDETFLASDQLGVPRLSLLLAALRALDDALRDYNARLLVRRGDPVTVLSQWVAEFGASSVYLNADYTPLAQRRDQAVRDALPVPVYGYDDVVLHPPGSVHTQTDTPYKVFTPFRRAWWLLPKPTVQPLAPGAFVTVSAEQAGGVPDLEDLSLSTPVDVPDARPEAALARLDGFTRGPIFDYATERDRLEANPFVDASRGTSAISCYLRLGMLSPRQAWAAGSAALDVADATKRQSVETWLSELAWRDFFTHVLAFFPHADHSAFNAAYEALPYRTAADELAAWQAGQTGFPVVDAAMRQLNTLGWMHNRARMIVASFLSKHLLLDWREGERTFMQRLIDGDPAVNNGNWQWAAGTGTDAQPFFRIFNPIAQSKKYDPHGNYIRTWVPELRDLPDRFIHVPWQTDSAPKTYPPPLLDLDAGRERALRAFEVVRQHRAALKTGR